MLKANKLAFEASLKRTGLRASAQITRTTEKQIESSLTTHNTHRVYTGVTLQLAARWSLLCVSVLS